MNPAPELAPQLKFLRLSGILDSLAARNRQAIESKFRLPDPRGISVGTSDQRIAHESAGFGVVKFLVA